MITSVSNSKGGCLSLSESGDIIVSGTYYIIHDNDLVNGGDEKYISKSDVMRIGERRYSSRKKLIATCVLFGISTISYGLIDKIKSGVAPVKSVTDKAGETAGYISDYDNTGISGVVKSISGAFGTVLDNLYNIIMIAAIIAFVISIYWLVRYIMSHKRLIEINTAKGFYCIDKSGINIMELDRLISDFYRLKEQPVQHNTDLWYCTQCGISNNGNFCMRCGQKKL